MELPTQGKKASTLPDCPTYLAGVALHLTLPPAIYCVMQDGTFRTHTCTVYEIITIKRGSQIISVEKLQCFDGLKII